MNRAFLLAMDGSQEAMWAADLAGLLARNTASALTVQTVVDSEGMWKLLGQKLPGVVGSGPYLAAYQSIQTILRSLAETLATACEARLGNNVTPEMVIDDGNVAEEICRRALQHDLLIIGHQEAHLFDNQFRHGQLKISLCQQIVEMCNSPVLIVQRPCQKWKGAKLVVSDETYSSSLLNDFLRFTESIGISAEVVCTGRSKIIGQLVDRVTSNLPEGSPVSVNGKKLHEIEAFYLRAAHDESDFLLAITTSNYKSGRYLCSGEALDHFLRDLDACTTLILPPAQVESAASHHAATSTLHKI